MSQSNKSSPCTNKNISLKVGTNTLKRETDSTLVNELKTQWNLMWKESFNDKTKAESISITNYSAIHVTQGTVIQASRDYKVLEFKELLEQYKVENLDKFIPPDNNTGGWHKFIKTKITNADNKALKEKHVTTHAPINPKGKQLKKCGRGWIHKS